MYTVVPRETGPNGEATASHLSFSSPVYGKGRRYRGSDNGSRKLLLPYALEQWRLGTCRGWRRGEMTSKTNSLRRSEQLDNHSSGGERTLPSFQQQPFSHVLQQIRSRAPRLNLRSANGKSRTSASDTDESGAFRSGPKPLDKASMKSTDSSLEGSADGIDIRDGHAVDEPDLMGPEQRVRFAIDTYRVKLERVQLEFDQLERERKSLVDDFMQHSEERLAADVNPKVKQRFDARQLELQNNSQMLQKKMAKYQDRIKQLEEKGVVDQSVLQDVKQAWQSMAAKHSLQLPTFKASRLFGSNHNIQGDGVTEERLEDGQASLASSSGCLVAREMQDESLAVTQPSDTRQRSANEDLSLELEACREKLRTVEAKVDCLQQQLDKSRQRTDAIAEDVQTSQMHLSKMTESYDNLVVQVDENAVHFQQMQLALSDAVTAFDDRNDQLQTQMYANRHELSEQCNMLEDALERNEARVTEVEHRIQSSLPEALHDNHTSESSSVMVKLVNTLIIVLRFLLSTWLKLSRRDITVLLTAATVFCLSLLFSYWWG